MKLRIEKRLEAKPAEDGWIYITPDQLSSVVNASCQYIDARDIIDYIDHSVFLQIVSKLRHGGLIEISGIDMFELSRHIDTGILNPDQVRSLLFDDKKSIYSLSEAENLFIQKELEVLEKNVGHCKFYIKARRK